MRHQNVIHRTGHRDVRLVILVLRTSGRGDGVNVDCWTAHLDTVRHKRLA